MSDHLWINTPEALRDYAQTDGDSYFVTVVFKRSAGDDLDVIGRPFNAETASRQFVIELQEHYDTTGMAGHFEVVEVRLRPEQVQP